MTIDKLRIMAITNTQMNLLLEVILMMDKAKIIDLLMIACIDKVRILAPQYQRSINKRLSRADVCWYFWITHF